MAHQLPQVFIAHSSRDKKLARRIAHDLKQNSVRVWIDEAQMAPGDSLYRSLNLGLAESDYICVILSPSSLSSKWVQREVAAGEALEIEDGRLRIVPVLYRRCDIPPFLRDRIYEDMRHHSRYEKGLARLLRRFIGDLLEFRIAGEGTWFPTLELQDDKWQLPTWQEAAAISHRLPPGIEYVWTCSDHEEGMYVYDVRKNVTS